MHRDVDWVETKAPSLRTTGVMDHTALKSVLGESDNTSSRICRWQYRLQEYDLDVVHVSGKLMQVADGLSVTMLAVP